MQNILHTPDGVRDIYERECEQKLALQEKLHSVIRSYGYHDIETPTFEFFDVFGSEIGTTPSRELYKFFDREGNTLVLRPDFTPSVARAAAKYFPDGTRPVRLTYLGNTFINHMSYQGRLKETTQIGGERIGDDSADADAESIALVVQLLLAAGLCDFQISLGHVGFFQSLVNAAGLDEETAGALRELIENKNTFGVEALLAKRALDPTLRKLFEALPGLSGTEEVLDRAASMTEDPGALAALARLREIRGILRLYGVEAYVAFDLGMLNGYDYYTGIMFRGYTFGTGDAVIKGGRYDHLLRHFGKDAPAVGFVAVIDQLISALQRQKRLEPVQRQRSVILYTENQLPKAVRRASELRAEGICVELFCIRNRAEYESCRAQVKGAALEVLAEDHAEQ